MRPHAVYTFRDHDGAVLYVGCSANLPQRIYSHDRTQPWWHRVATVGVEHLPDRTSARRREGELIADLKPLHSREWQRPLPTGGVCCSRWRSCGALAKYRVKSGNTLHDTWFNFCETHAALAVAAGRAIPLTAEDAEAVA